MIYLNNIKYEMIIMIGNQNINRNNNNKIILMTAFYHSNLENQICNTLKHFNQYSRASVSLVKSHESGRYVWGEYNNLKTSSLSSVLSSSLVSKPISVFELILMSSIDLDMTGIPYFVLILADSLVHLKWDRIKHIYQIAFPKLTYLLILREFFHWD